MIVYAYFGRDLSSEVTKFRPESQLFEAGSSAGPGGKKNMRVYREITEKPAPETHLILQTCF